MTNVLRSTGATAVGVSCDGGIVYAAFAGIGMAVSVAPGYVSIPVDPDQVTTMSGRAIAGMYDLDLMASRREAGPTSGAGGGQSTRQDGDSSDGPLGPLYGLPEYVLECARERLGLAWAELEAGRPATAEEEALITACERSGGDPDRMGDSGGVADPGLEDLPEAVTECIRSQLPPGVWDTLWEGRPPTPDEQSLIDGCEASGGNMG
jgi:hypothetical protein